MFSDYDFRYKRFDFKKQNNTKHVVFIHLLKKLENVKGNNDVNWIIGILTKRDLKQTTFIILLILFF